METANDSVAHTVTREHGGEVASSSRSGMTFGAQQGADGGAGPENLPPVEEKKKEKVVKAKTVAQQAKAVAQLHKKLRCTCMRP